MTDGQKDRQTDRRTDRILLAIPRLHYMQRGKKEDGVAILFNTSANGLLIASGRLIRYSAL